MDSVLEVYAEMVHVGMAEPPRVEVRQDRLPRPPHLPTRLPI